MATRPYSTVRVCGSACWNRCVRETPWLPRNTLVTGTGRIQGDRLGIGIVSLEYGGLIIPVELTVYDSDGQEGIYIPNSAEVSAAKEVAANLGQNLGTSISITNQSAGDQLLSELGKGAIQGVSQYVSKNCGRKRYISNQVIL